MLQRSPPERVSQRVVLEDVYRRTGGGHGGALPRLIVRVSKGHRLPGATRYVPYLFMVPQRSLVVALLSALASYGQSEQSLSITSRPPIF